MNNYYTIKIPKIKINKKVIKDAGETIIIFAPFIMIVILMWYAQSNYDKLTLTSTPETMIFHLIVMTCFFTIGMCCGLCFEVWRFKK